MIGRPTRWSREWDLVPLLLNNEVSLSSKQIKLANLSFPMSHLQDSCRPYRMVTHIWSLEIKHLNLWMGQIAALIAKGCVNSILSLSLIYFFKSVQLSNSSRNAVSDFLC